MPRDSDISGGRDSWIDKESGLDKSFVKKVKSRVSGFIPSSLSKWFGGSEEGSQKVRPRDDLEDDEESFNLQPPTKRQKKPASDNIGRDALNFISTPIHHTQLSFTNFQEPAPSSSGIRSRKLLLPNVSTKNYSTPIDLHNGDKDSDSGESTSGYSSMPRIGSKEQVSEIVDKQCTSTSNSLANRSIFSSTMTHERTLFPERSVSPQRNSSLSSRRPSFNASTFGSPNFMDRTLSTKRIVNSPFYGGRTTYGGASAYSHNLSKISNEDRSCLKTFVQAKPVNESSNKSVMLSKTAKRILDTLEQYTSPSEDVRKIPNPSTKRNHKLDNLSSKYTGANPYFVRESRVPSNKELIVPTVTDLLKIKMKERLQDSTVSVREIATKSNSPLNTEKYTIRTRETPNTNIKNTNKIKTKVSSVREKKQDATDVETVKLPNVQLPISKLPNFDFTIPSPFVSNKESNIKPVPSKEPVCIEQKKTETIQAILTPRTDKEDFKPIEYIFSKPLVLAENLKTIKAINNFKFSKPVCKKVVEQVTEANTFKNFTFTSTSTRAPIMHPLKKTVPKNNGDSGFIATAKKLETGSVMDVLGKKNELSEKFKPAPDTWECSICLIRNTADKKKCAACETPRSTNQLTQEETKTQVTGFGDKFKITSDQWECTECFVRNDANKSKCAACDSPKKTQSAPINTFGNQFKMSADKWECSVCLVRNDSTKTSCVACTTQKPGSNSGKENAAIAEQFKPKVTYWECKTCLAKNDLTTPKCVTCKALNPGPLLVEKKKNQWDCPTCMIKNDDSLYKCQCCETPQPGKTKPIPLNPKEQVMPTFCFGIDKAQLNGHGFIFGIPENNKTQSEETGTNNNSFVFGETKVESKPATGFVFGIPNGTKTQVTESKPNEVPKVEEQKQFTFGIQNNTKSLKRGANDNVVSVDAKKSDTSFTTSGPSIIPPINGSHENTEKSTQLNNSQPTSTSNAPSSMFNFTVKPPAAPATATPEKPQVPAPEFKFGSKNKNTLTKSNSSASLFATTKSNSDSTHTLNTNNNINNASTFGSTAKENSGFKFNAPTKTDTAPAPGVFTFSSSKAMADMKTPLFNAENKPEANTFSVANKTVNPQATQPSAAFNFSPRLPAGGFSFNASKNDVSFGSPSPAAPTFAAPAANTTFATPAVNPPAFGTNTASFAAPSTNPPAYGTSTNVPTFGAPTTQGPTFGATNTTPAFGTPSGNTFGNLSSNASFGAPAQTAPNGMFNFGSGTSSTTPKTGYNFGAAQAPSQPGGFSFTANHNMNPPAPSAGGFNFGAPASAPTLNPDIKPSFNFTAGAATTTFTAQQSGETKPRVIRKALRRTAHR